jgi:acyl-coenzyme A thioesterase PaaI-like protein
VAQGAQLPGEYPPPRHMLRDLHLETWRDAAGPGARIPVSPHLRGPAGVRLGVLATLADVAGGGAALEAVNPDWIATSDLTVHRLGGPGRGALEARARVSRAGRGSVLLEVDVRDDEGPIALATMGFTRLRARGGFQQHAGRPADRFAFALPDSGLDRPFLDAIGATTRDAAAGVVELAVTPYVGNSLGALQGGAATVLLDRAAELAGGTALGAAAVVMDLSVHFVALGRVGPMRTQASLLRRREDAALLRVALVDDGAEGRLGALATAWVERAPG